MRRAAIDGEKCFLDDDMYRYETNHCMIYLATELSVQAAHCNLSRASETIGGWVGAPVRTA
jgi:ferredoxin-thioredoxin reductase catalytic subunit